MSTDPVIILADSNVNTEIFTQGDCLDAPAGLRFGPDGNLYVANKSAIMRIDGFTGKCLGKFNYGDPPLSPTTPLLLYPDDLIFYNAEPLVKSSQTDELSQFLVSDRFHNRFVSYRGITGEYLGQLSISSSIPGSGNNLSPYTLEIGPTNLLVSKTGPTIWDVSVKNLFTYVPSNLYFLTHHPYQSIYRFHFSSGKNPIEIIRFGHTGAYPLKIPIDFVFGPDNYLYVIVSNTASTSSISEYSIERYDMSDGAFIDTFITLSRRIGITQEVTVPFPANSLAFGPDGDLYVRAQYGSDFNILRYKGGTGEFIEVFVYDHEMGSSGEIIWGPDGKLYASDTTGNQVRRYWSVEDQSCSDVDNDNICDSEDNCLDISNPGQTDWDHDGLGDFCDDF